MMIRLQQFCPLGRGNAELTLSEAFSSQPSSQKSETLPRRLRSRCTIPPATVPTSRASNSEVMPHSLLSHSLGAPRLGFAVGALLCIAAPGIGLAASAG